MTVEIGNQMAIQLAERLASRLLAGVDVGGFLPGYLSSSALATALGVFALSAVDAKGEAAAIGRGLAWLRGDQNADGGWGDSPTSPSNQSTTLLVWATLSHCSGAGAGGGATARGAAWLEERIGELTSERLRAAVLADYGDDRTFSVPILTVLALADKLAWHAVPQLPFELGVLPQRLYRWLRLPVVSYALPALLAIGLVRHRRQPSRCWPWRWLRSALAPSVKRRLLAIQPSNGGFLEASPLTAFVLASLAGAGEGEAAVAIQAANFLRSSQRADGSWPIDTHLATWLTSLAVDALAPLAARSPVVRAAFPAAAIRDYLLAAQHRCRHLATGAAPGGWGWTHLPGGVPDADDTAAALIALRHLAPEPAPETLASVEAGLVWLLGLQNGDGGMPTFCRGWGRFPFDRSCPDITAHALRAFCLWADQVPALAARLRRAATAALAYLHRVQTPAGAWLPLWFGSQQTARRENPVYGTGQVLVALEALVVGGWEVDGELLDRARAFLRSSQTIDGGWGAEAGVPPSVEETAIAARALRPSSPDAWARAVRWLTRQAVDGQPLPAAPIGLYFARLWYAEKLYPLIHAVAAVSPPEIFPGRRF